MGCTSQLGDEISLVDHDLHIKSYSVIMSWKLFRFTGDIDIKHTCTITLMCALGHNLKCMSHHRPWFLDKGIL